MLKTLSSNLSWKKLLSTYIKNRLTILPRSIYLKNKEYIDKVGE